DFEFLFADESRGVENDPRLEGGANLVEPGVDDWFVPFADAALVHPYVEPTSTGPVVHDLRHRLPAIDGPPHRLDRELNAPDPVVAVEAGSPAVAQARRA